MYNSTQLPYQQPFPGQPQPSFYTPQPGPVFPGGSPYATGGGRPMLLVDMFSSPSQVGMPSPMGLPQVNGASSAPESGGSGLKKFAVGATILCGLGALAYSKSWWPFKGEADEDDASTTSGRDDESTTSRGEDDESGGSSDALKRERALGNLQKLVKEKQKRENFRAAQEELVELRRQEAREEEERRLKLDSEMLGNGLSRADDRRLSLQLQPAYANVLDALDNHLQILKSREQAAQAEVVRAAEERVAKASEELGRAKQFKDKTWSTDTKEAQIREKRAQIADQVQINKNGLTVEENRAIGAQLATAYDQVRDTLSSPQADDKAEKVEQAFTRLKAARTFKDSAGWQQKTREEELVPLLKTYKGEYVESYQRLKDGELIWPDTLKQVEPVASV